MVALHMLTPGGLPRRLSTLDSSLHRADWGIAPRFSCLFTCLARLLCTMEWSEATASIRSSARTGTSSVCVSRRAQGLQKPTLRDRRRSSVAERRNPCWQNQRPKHRRQVLSWPSPSFSVQRMPQPNTSRCCTHFSSPMLRGHTVLKVPSENCFGQYALGRGMCGHGGMGWPGGTVTAQERQRLRASSACGEVA